MPWKQLLQQLQYWVIILFLNLIRCTLFLREKTSFLIRVLFSISFFPVQDEQDEFPIFEQATYQSTVKENSENEFVTKVTAIDKDEVASVTYEIISGDRNLFEIDPKSGEIRTQKGLDYEIQRMHFLTISTEESRGIFNGKQTTCIGKKLCLRKKGPVCNVNFQFHENMKSFHLFFLQHNFILKKKVEISSNFAL